jgi:beta-carotene hydroxylase
MTEWPLSFAERLDPAECEEFGSFDSVERKALLLQERAVASRFFARAEEMVPYAAIALAGFALWLSFIPLAILGLVPLWACCLASCVFATGGYLIAHESMHGNIAPRGSGREWLNGLVGHVALLPIAFPYSAARLLHLEHHHHCNDPERDPDHIDNAPTALRAWLKTWVNRQPGERSGSIPTFVRVLRAVGTPDARRAIGEMKAFFLIYLAVLFAMAWAGFAIEGALLLWLPRQVGLSYIRFYLSWAPHHPHEGRTGRYDAARIFRSRLGTVLSMGFETHLIHHLYPNIPNHRTREAYFALKPVLEQRGVDISAL